MTADAGADGRAMLALQATVKDLGARLVQLETARAVLESAGPSPEESKVNALFNPDQGQLSEADRAAMRKRLMDRTIAAARANAEKHRRLAADREAGKDIS